jgi:phosphatidylglycerol:prolipoprotein diacylglycerol transferase
LTPFFAILSLSMAFSHLASGNAFGSPTSLPWAIDLWGMPRHPTQIYEILLSIGILILIWPGKGLLWDSQPGVTFLRFLALTAIGVILLEAFRGDSILIIQGLRRDQVIAWITLAASLIGLWILYTKRKFPV